VIQYWKGLRFYHSGDWWRWCLRSHYECRSIRPATSDGARTVAAIRTHRG